MMCFSIFIFDSYLQCNSFWYIKNENFLMDFILTILWPVKKWSFSLFVYKSNEDSTEYRVLLIGNIKFLLLRIYYNISSRFLVTWGRLRGILTSEHRRGPRKESPRTTLFFIDSLVFVWLLVLLEDPSDFDKTRSLTSLLTIQVLTSLFCLAPVTNSRRDRLKEERTSVRLEVNLKSLVILLDSRHRVWT